MRNFFKNTFDQFTTIKKKQLAELLETREEKVINQYKSSLKFINSVKNEILENSHYLIKPKKSIKFKLR